MILKEAYRYQNFLNNLIEEAENWLRNPDYVKETTRVHYRHKVNPDADPENEIEVVQPSRTLPECDPNKMLDFVVKALDEKQKLSDAIAATKKATEIDQDSSVAMNKAKQSFIYILRSMANLKNSTTKTTGLDYKFDINGEQKPYKYDIEVNSNINFDRKSVRGLVQKYSKETDAVSAQLDEIMITAEVDYSPLWEMTDTLEDIIADSVKA